MTNHTLFIDESGEAGISKVRTEKSGGASPYMTFGAAMIPDQLHEELTAELSKLAGEFNKKNLHCSSLNHVQKVRYAKVISQKRILCFGLISLKETLGDYKEDISDDSKKYYNKCAQYLLERVGEAVKHFKIAPEKLRIVFEEGNFNYEALRRLIEKCQKNPLHRNTRLLKNIQVENITTAPKADEPLLQVSDLIAHSLYWCVNKSEKNYNITEPRYLRELSSKFFSHPDTDRVEGTGLKVIHTLKDLKLDAEIHTFLDELKRPKQS